MKDVVIYLAAFVVIMVVWQLFWRTTFFLFDLRSLPIFIVAACVCGLIVMKIRKRR